MNNRCTRLTGRKGRLRRMAVLLCFCVLITAFADIPAAFYVFAASGSPDTEERIILAFRALPDEVRKQSVPMETNLDELVLPDTMEAVMSGSAEGSVSSSDHIEADAPSEKQEEAIAISSITWQSSPEYDGSAEGIYIFTAALPQGCTLAEGIVLPQITVTVREQGNDEDNPEQGDGTDMPTQENGMDGPVQGNDKDTLVEGGLAQEDEMDNPEQDSGMDFRMEALSARIAALPETEEYLAAEPDMEGNAEAYALWEQKLYEYAEEALAIWVEYKALTGEQQAEEQWADEQRTEGQQAQISGEEPAKLAAWVELAGMLGENITVMASAAGEHGTHSGWTQLTGSTKTLTGGKSYYLAGDVELSNPLTVTGGTVTLCLNRHKLTCRLSDQKAWIITVESGAELNLYDCADGGMIEATVKGGGISTSGRLNVYGGVISGKCTTSDSQNADNLISLTYSAGVCAQAGSEVNLYGGTVQGTESSGVYVASGGKLTVDGAAVTSQVTRAKVTTAGLYIEGGAEAEVRSGALSLASDTYNSAVIVVSPGGGLTVSGGVVSHSGSSGGISIEKAYYHSSTEAAHALISGGTITTGIVARSGMSVAVTGGSVTGGIILYGGALEMHGSQDIQVSQNMPGSIGAAIYIGRDGNKPAVGKIRLTGALTNAEPYKVSLGGVRPSSAYPLTITEGFGSYMSGREPSDYFVSVDGYKVILLNGETAFVPYVMAFDANGGSVETQKGDMNGGQAMKNLPEPTREHYNFDGWYTQKDGGDEITIDTIPSGQDMTVYAHWTPKDYAISYDLAGGELPDGVSNPATYHIEMSEFTLQNPVRAGYVFTGWSGTGLTGEANITVKVPKGSAGERSYTAHWEEAKYKVTVSTYRDDVPWSSSAPTVKLIADNGTSFRTDLSAVGNGTYKIYSGNTDTGVIVTVGGGDAAARVDYYTVVFQSGNSELSRQTVLKGKTPGKPSVPARTGYAFAGWCDNAALTGAAVTEISTPITEKKTFYAKWTANTYQAAFDYHGADGGNITQSKVVTFDSAYGVLPAPSKAGYTFKGWYTGENGQGSKVDAETVVKTAATHTLHACWQDETPPAAPVLQDGVTLPADWTKAQDAIPLTLSDGVGVTELWVSVDGGGYTKADGFAGGTGSVSYDYSAAEGEHTYCFKAKDGAGNTSDESAVFTVRLDREKPVIGAVTYENKAADLWQWIIGKKSMIVHVPVTDESSGVAQISFCLTPRDGEGNIDGSQAITKTAAVKEGEARLTFDTDFKGTITIGCTDTAGNAANSVTIGAAAGGVLVEDRAPVITVQADRELSDLQQTKPDGAALAEGYYDSAPALLVTISDDSDNAVTAGIASVTWQIGDGAEESVSIDTSTMQTEVSFVISAAQIPTSVTEIKITTVDNAGNEAVENVTVRVKGPERRPAAEIDYREEKLTDLVPGGKYSINGTEHTADENGCIRIREDWIGSSVNIVKEGNGSETTDSLAQSLSLPARPGAPGAPELNARTDRSITLNTIAGAHYRIDDGNEEKSWQDSTVFTELEHRTVYSFRAYYPATDTSFASLESDAARIATIPKAPAADAPVIDYTSESFFLPEDMQAFSDESCTTPVTSDSVESYMGQTIYIRCPADGIVPAGPVTAVVIPVRAQKPAPGSTDASYPGALDGALTGLTAGKAHEIRKQKDDGTWEDTWTSVMATAEGIIDGLEKGVYEVRVQAVSGENFRSEAVAVSIGGKPAAKHETPDIQIDLDREVLTGFVPEAWYKVEYTDSSGEEHAEDLRTENGTILLKPEWFGRTISIVRTGNQKDKLDSDARSLTVPAKGPEPTPKPDEPKPTPAPTEQPGGTPATPAPVPTEQPGGTPAPAPTEQPGKTPATPTPAPAGTSTSSAAGPSANVTPLTPTQPAETPDNQKEDQQRPGGTGTAESTGQPVETENRRLPGEAGEQILPVFLDNERLTVSGESVATGNVQEMKDTSTVLKLEDGAVIVTVACAEQKITAGVADTVAVANAVLTPEQMELVNSGETMEVRIDVKDISGKVPQQDKRVIENGIDEYKKEVPELTLGMYIDISMFMKIGGGSWNAITATDEPIEVVVGIPEELQIEGREFYIVRAHGGEYTLLRDTDDASDTITVSTNLFSCYAIAYVETGETGVGAGHKCGLCHICPTFLGICYFIWLLIVVLLALIICFSVRRKGREEKIS